MREGVLSANRIGERAFGPDEQIRPGIGAKRDLIEALKPLEDLLGELWIELLPLWNICLDGCYAQRFRGCSFLNAIQSERKQRDHANHREGEIEVRAHSAGARFLVEAHRCCHGDDVRESDCERQTAYARE